MNGGWVRVQHWVCPDGAWHARQRGASCCRAAAAMRRLWPRFQTCGQSPAAKTRFSTALDRVAPALGGAPPAGSPFGRRQARPGPRPALQGPSSSLTPDDAPAWRATDTAISRPAAAPLAVNMFLLPFPLQSSNSILVSTPISSFGSFFSLFNLRQASPTRAPVAFTASSTRPFFLVDFTTFYSLSLPLSIFKNET